MERLAVGGGGGGGEPDPAGRDRERGEHHQRFEARDLRRMAVLAAGQPVGEEHHVELGALGGHRLAHQMRQVLAAGVGTGIAPARDVVPRALQEHAEMHLSGRCCHAKTPAANISGNSGGCYRNDIDKLGRQ